MVLASIVRGNGRERTAARQRPIRTAESAWKAPSARSPPTPRSRTESTRPLPRKGMAAWTRHWAGWTYSQEWWRQELFKPRTVDEMMDILMRYWSAKDANNLISQARTWRHNNVCGSRVDALVPWCRSRRVCTWRHVAPHAVFRINRCGATAARREDLQPTAWLARRQFGQQGPRRRLHPVFARARAGRTPVNRRQPRAAGRRRS